MFSLVVGICRRVVHGLLANDSTNQLAAGFTLGVIVGLVPKGNLIALSLCVLLFSLRINKGLALVAVLLFSSINPWIDSFSHKLGLAILSADAFQPLYAMAMGLPLGPWLEFNNTVVAGSLAIGLYIAYPAYWTSGVVCTWLRPIVLRWIPRNHSLNETTNRSASRAAA